MDYSKNFYQIKSNEEIFYKISSEKNTIGYYDLPFQDTSTFKEYAKTVIQQDIVVVGIGGSSLGTYAIHKFLQHKENMKKLHFLESTDPLDLERRVSKLDLKDTLFIIISKSGTTIETVSILKYLSSITVLNKANTICITEYDSKLNTYAKSK